MAISRKRSGDAMFPQELIEPASGKPEDIQEFIEDMIRDVTASSDFDRTLAEVERQARAVLDQHPGMGTPDGSIKADAPLIVENAVEVLSSLPRLRRALEGTDPHEAGWRGFYLGLHFDRMLARRYERVAAFGATQLARSSTGGKQRAVGRQWTKEQARQVEHAIAEEKRRCPNEKMQSIRRRIARSHELSVSAMNGRIRRAKNR